MHSLGVLLFLNNLLGIFFSSCNSFTVSNKRVSFHAVDISETRYSQGGDPLGHDWVPAECDVSIRPGWFWHASQVSKSALELLDLYYKSVGRNCLLLLNVPPNSSGLISDEDVHVLKEFSKLRSSIFSLNLAKNALLSATSIRGGINYSRFSSNNVLEEGIYTYWAPDKDQSDWGLYLDFQEPVTFNLLQVQEPIQMGQRIVGFHLDILNDKGEWEEVTNGTTVGYQRLLLFPRVESRSLRFVIDKSRTDPLISYLGIYLDPFSILSHVSDTRFKLHSNGSQVLQHITYDHSQSASV